MAPLVLASCSVATVDNGETGYGMSVSESSAADKSTEAIAIATPTTPRLITREGAAFCTSVVDSTGHVDAASRTCQLADSTRAATAEGATATSDGRVWLWYRGLSVVDVFSADLTRRERTLSLDFSSAPKLSGLTSARVARGVVIGTRGHVLTAVSDPPAIVELGPRDDAATGEIAAKGDLPVNEALVALATWSLDEVSRRRMATIDGFAADGAGHAWVVCKATQTLSVLAALSTPGGNATATLAATYSLPDAARAPDAFAPLASGRWLVLNRATASTPASLILLSPH